MPRVKEYFKCLALQATITVECCERNKASKKPVACKSCKTSKRWHQEQSVPTFVVEQPQTVLPKVAKLGKYEYMTRVDKHGKPINETK
jgi:hypothetical protein